VWAGRAVQGFKPREAFHDCFRTYRAVRNRVALGTGSSLGGIFADCGVSSGSYGSNQPRKTDRMVEFGADFESAARVALEPASTELRKTFRVYCFDGVSFTDAPLVIGCNPRTFESWLREMKKLVGIQCFVRGLWAPKVGTNCYFSRAAAEFALSSNLQQRMYLDRRESIR
jgi:hypothetical protein